MSTSSMIFDHFPNMENCTCPKVWMGIGPPPVCDYCQKQESIVWRYCPIKLTDDVMSVITSHDKNSDKTFTDKMFRGYLTNKCQDKKYKHPLVEAEDKIIKKIKKNPNEDKFMMKKFVKQQLESVFTSDHSLNTFSRGKTDMTLTVSTKKIGGEIKTTHKTDKGTDITTEAKIKQKLKGKEKPEVEIKVTVTKTY